MSKGEVSPPPRVSSSCTVATAYTSQACVTCLSSSRQTVTAATEARLSSVCPAISSPGSSSGWLAKEIKSPTRTSSRTSSPGRPVSTTRYFISTGLPRAEDGSKRSGGCPITPGRSRRPCTVTGLRGQDARVHPADLGEIEEAVRRDARDHQANRVHVGCQQDARARLGAGPAFQARAGCPGG